MKRRDWLKALCLVDWSGSVQKEATPAQVFVNGKLVVVADMASETEGWVRFLMRHNLGPFQTSKDLLANNDFIIDKDEVQRAYIYGKVEIKFENPKARILLLKEQNEMKKCLHG